MKWRYKVWFILSGIAILFALICLRMIQILSSEVDSASILKYSINSWHDTRENFKAPIEHPIVLWWTPFTGEAGMTRQCEIHSCFFTNSREYLGHPKTQVLMFYGSNFRATDLPVPRGKHHQWGLLHEESPKNNFIFSYQQTLQLFNHTATFKRQSDFPLTLQYLDKLDSLLSDKLVISTKNKNKLMTGKMSLAPVAYVSSDCDVPSARDEFVTELMKLIKVDSYGKCLHNKDLPKHLQDPMTAMDNEEFHQILAQYKFILAFENAVCDDYITEKLWRSLVVGSVPIYYGSPSVTDWLPNQKSAILVNNFSSVSQLAMIIQKLNSDDAEYDSYLTHKRNRSITNQRLKKTLQDRNWDWIGNSPGAVVEDLNSKNFVEQFECFVCERVHKMNAAVSVGLPLPRSYQATRDHYGCPLETAPFVKTDSWWVDMYRKAEVESQVLADFVRRNRAFKENEYHAKVYKLLSQRQRG